MNRFLLIPLMLVSTLGFARVYTTNFPANESPISQNGVWVNGLATGLDFANINTSGGKALGTQVGTESCPSNCNDSTAVVIGSWGATQTCEVTVAVSNAPTTSPIFQEAECRVRTTITAHSITGYELNCSISTNGANAYMQIVRWNGALGNFTQLSGDGGVHHCVNGDVIKLVISGSTLTAFLNGTIVSALTTTDSTYTAGFPGIGLFITGCSTSVAPTCATLKAANGISNVTLSDTNTALWSGVLAPTYGVGACTFLASGTYAGCGVDWSTAGAGGITVGTQSGSTITSTGSNQLTAINSALTTCGGAASSGAHKFVQLAAGTFTIGGNLNVPSYCTLLGMGADQTILNCTGTGGGGCVQLAQSAPTAGPGVPISAGTAVAGSNSLTVSSGAGFSSGQLVVVNELNLNGLVNLSGGPGGGNCTFCETVFGTDTKNGESRARNQIVKVTGVAGTAVAIEERLFTDFVHNLPTWVASTNYPYMSVITANGHYYYQTVGIAQPSPYYCVSKSGTSPVFPTNGTTVTDNTCVWQDGGVGITTVPMAYPYTPIHSAGVMNLQIKQNLSGYDQDTLIRSCDRCFIKGIEDNYADGDHVDVQYDYHSEIRDSYFSNAFTHGPGSHDSTVDIMDGSTSTLVENNIMERMHIGEMVEIGTAGAVFGYNFHTGIFDSGSFNFLTPGHNAHAAHTQFILTEGDVTGYIFYDSTWGSHSHGTNFRNWSTGTFTVCSPQSDSRSVVTCSPFGFPQQSGKNSYNVFQASRAETFDYPDIYFNTIGNVLGSAAQLALTNTSNSALSDTAVINFPTLPRHYDTVTFNRTTGYSGSSDGDTGSGFASDSALPSTTLLVHGDYTNTNSTTSWQSGIPEILPNSFYLSGQPAWWPSGKAWPQIGPDISGGTGPGGHVVDITAGNAAQYCYLTVMGGTDGGAGSPLSFNADACYAGGPTTVATPTFSPLGPYSGPPTSVTISTITAGATLCYTVDGSTPTGNGGGTCTHGTTYTGLVSVGSTLTLKAIGTLGGDLDSAVGSATYTIFNTRPAPVGAFMTSNRGIQ